MNDRFRRPLALWDQMSRNVRSVSESPSELVLDYVDR